MFITALIPARYGAIRFPGKLMQSLGGRSVIRRTYEAARDTDLFQEVIVATDSDEIENEILSVGGNVFRSKQPHESGTDRIAEATEDLTTDLIINIQGDTPFIKKEPLEKLIALFQDPTVSVASMMQVLEKNEEIDDPNFVKVAIDRKSNALFFSRSRIPFPRDPDQSATYYEHIGVYAFRKRALLDFISWPMGELESVEKVECLRFLENGVPIRMLAVDYIGVEIDTPDDLKKAEKLL
ncbi:MAG: 3-deoxy-manno-octulosonate cytidylyltransferase [Bacteroidetes bacterium]|nr:3-deoxy-manno-octulosonate cytidylyltransferase [Bacteroidota bacterium]